MNVLRSLGQATFITAFAISLSAAQWVQTANSPKGSGITDLVVRQSNGYLFATTGSFNWPNADTGGVHRSTDGGDTWTRVFPAYIARTIALKQDSILFASVWPIPAQTEGLYYSTNNGNTWNLTWDGGPSNNVFAVAFDPSNPLRAYNGSRYGIARNLSGGTTGTWSVISNLPLGSWVRDIAIDQNGWVFVAAQHQSNPNLNGVYYSTNQGQSFTRIGGIPSGDTIATVIVVKDTTSTANSVVDQEALYAGTTRGTAYRAAILGFLSFELSFAMAGIPTIGSFFFRSPPTTIAAAYLFLGYFLDVTNGGGIAYTTDRGRTWYFYNEGFPAQSPVAALAGHERSPSTDLYSGLFLNQNNGGPVYRRTITTDVRTAWSDLQEAFALYQNHPNPFNPTTTIRYDLPFTGRVSLKVFDILGREVATLVNEVKEPGEHSVTFEASRMSSGVYFYRMRAGEYQSIKKLLLLK